MNFYSLENDFLNEFMYFEKKLFFKTNLCI